MASGAGPNHTATRSLTHAVASAPRRTTDRTALIGDAAWGVTLGGMGVAPVSSAYVLSVLQREFSP